MKRIIFLKKLSLLGAMSLLLFSACNSSKSKIEENPSDSSQLNPNLKNGHFIDAHVIGLEYVTAPTEGEGLTGNYGDFRYMKGDTLTFSFGKMTLATVNPNGKELLTPQTIAEILSPNDVNRAKELKVLLLRTLQTLDSDANLSNGISLDRSKFENLERSSFKDATEVTLIDALPSLDKNSDGSIDVSEADALVHFEESMKNWNEGKRPEDAEVECVEEGETECLEAKE